MESNLSPMAPALQKAHALLDRAGWPVATDIPEFCRRYGISRSKVYDEAKAGRLRLTKVGRKTLISADDAAAWFAALPKANTAKAA